LAEVFTFCADPRHDPAWQSGLVRHENLPDGPFEVGAAWTEVRRLGGRPTRVHLQVTGYSSPAQLAFTADASGMRARGRIDFESVGSATRVTQYMSFGGWLAPLIAWQTGRELRTNLALLRQVLESRGGGRDAESPA